MLINLSQKYPLQNFINLSRIKDIDSMQLAYIHKEFGKLLALEILGMQEKISKTQNLNYDKLETLQYFDDSNFVIIGILRAGLYIAEGVREMLPKAEFILVKNANEIDLQLIKNKKIILADSVINTGKSIKKFLDIFDGDCIIYIATNVIYELTCKSLLNNYKFIKILCIRSSSNSYKGSGSSDSGNRLFNSF